MIEMRADYAIAKMVEHVLPVGSEHGLYVRLRVTLTNLGATRYRNGKLVRRTANSSRDSVETTRYFHLLFHRVTNYTKVWSYMGGHERPQPEQWEMMSYHDSCWRTDGFRQLTRGYFEMADNIRLPSQAPKDMECYSNMDVSKMHITMAPAGRWVDVLECRTML